MSFYSQGFEDLEVKLTNQALWLTLSNEKMSNAITSEMINSIERVLFYAETDNDVRVVVVTGKGKNFCSGGDVKAMEKKEGMFSGESYELALNYKKGIQRIPKAIESFQKPIVAMVNGAAIGAGCDLACMCDMRIASSKAKFGETFSKLGLVPGDGGTFFLQRVVGYSKAMEMILTGDIYDSQKAYEMGLVNKVVNDELLREEVESLCSKIVKVAPVGLQLTKRALKQAMNQELFGHLEMLSVFQGVAQRTEDHFEGVSALLDRRDPEFKGR